MTGMEGRGARLRLIWDARQPARSQAAQQAACIGRAEGIRGPETVELPFERLRRGLYISGKPRTGKSTILSNLVGADFRHGRGACVIDPHGELITAILERLPVRKQRDLERILVFDPTNLEHPIGIDLLAAADPFEEDHAIQFLVEIIERVTPPFTCGPMLFQGIRNGMRLLFETKSRLTDLPRLLVDKSYLQEKLTDVRDPLLRRYWEKDWPSLLRSSDGGGYVAYITSKFSQFLDDRCLRNIFGQRGGLDLRKVIESGQLLLVDLARGKLGAARSQFLALVLLHCLERTVMRGPTLSAEPAPPPFSVYIDEAHELDVENLRRMITAFPKQNAALVLANQAVTDLGERLRATIFGSVASFLFLRQGPETAPTLEHLVQPRFDACDLLNLRDFVVIYRADLPGARCARRVMLAPPGPAIHDMRMISQLREFAALRIGCDRRQVEQNLLASPEPSEKPPRR